jgi:hypothetical protein
MEPHPMSSDHEDSLRLEIAGVPGVGHLETQKAHLDFIQTQDHMKQQVGSLLQVVLTTGRVLPTQRLDFG